MTDFIVVSYFTAKTGYEKEVKTLEASLIHHKIEPYHIERVSNMGNWQKNTLHKARFVLQMMEKFPDYSIVFTDADSIFHGYPMLFQNLDGADFACHFRNWQARQGELLSGTLYFSNTPKMRNVVKEWIGVNKNNQQKFEQRNLERVIRRNAHKINIYKLPIEYCCIFDDENRKQIKPMVEHFQASRRLKRGLS